MRILFVIGAMVMGAAVFMPASAKAADVKVTPLGSHDGEFCRFDRAILFEPATDGREEVPLAVKTVLGHFEHWLARGRPEQAAESFHRRMLSETVWERMPAAARAQACGGWRHIHSDLRATADYRISPTALRELKTPFLLLRGARSSPAFEAPLRGLARALPRARVEVLESAGHQIAGAGWRETADAVAGFLDA